MTDKMTRRERIMAASRGRLADRLPFFHYWRHSQIGWAERACRNRGMGMCWYRPCYAQRMHGVEVTEQPYVSDGQTIVRRTYSTPVGVVWTEENVHFDVAGLFEPGENWIHLRARTSKYNDPRVVPSSGIADLLQPVVLMGQFRVVEN